MLRNNQVCLYVIVCFVTKVKGQPCSASFPFSVIYARWTWAPVTCKSVQTRNQSSHIAGLQVTHWNFDSRWHFYFKALKLIWIVFKWICNVIKQLKPKICCLRKHFHIFNNHLWLNHLWIEHYYTQISFKLVKWHWCENFQTLVSDIFNSSI